MTDTPTAGFGRPLMAGCFVPSKSCAYRVLPTEHRPASESKRVVPPKGKVKTKLKPTLTMGQTWAPGRSNDMVKLADDSAKLGSMSDWRAEFERMLPEIEYRALRAFRGVGRERSDRLVAQVTEHAFEVFVYLAHRGKADLVYAKPLAMSAIEQVRISWRLPIIRPF